MEEVEEALNSIEIPAVNVDEILNEVKRHMPSREEVAAYKEVVRDALREVRKIDLTHVERALERISEVLSDIREEHRRERQE